jgi:phage shock protein A
LRNIKKKTISYRKQWLDAEALAVSYENLTERLKEEVIELRQHPQILEQQIETLKKHIAQLEAQVVPIRSAARGAIYNRFNSRTTNSRAI